MKSIIMIGMALALSVGARAWADDVPPGVTVEQKGDNYTVTKAPPGEPDVTIKVDAPKGTTEQEIAAAIARENAARDPAAQQAAKVAKEKAAEDEAHHERIAKICDSIPEKAMRNDPSLRKMCE